LELNKKFNLIKQLQIIEAAATNGEGTEVDFV